MKIFYFLLVLSSFFYACNKSDNTTETLSSEDIAAANGMSTQLTGMQQSLNNLISASDANQRRHWDSIYHRHDSLFWHHHNNYHHNVYAHDDHGHQWVPYDPAVNHHNHHHPHYPGHLNDSLIVTTNNHHHTNCDHHPGHHICHHHTINSLHHLHILHHP